MDLLFILFTGFTIGITGALIPGPLTFFTVSEAMKTGKHAGLKAIAGHIAVEMIIVLTIFLGFHKFFKDNTFLTFMYLVGGVALAIMGFILMLKSSKMKLLDRESHAKFNKGLFIGGAFFSIASPGFIIWWATIGVSTVVRALLLGISGVIFLTIGHWLADIAWYWLMSYAVHKGKAYINERSYRHMIRCFSLLLVFLGFYYIFLAR